MSVRRSALPLRLLVVLAMAFALVPSIAMPEAVAASDFSRSDGRLIVVWRTTAPASVDVAGVARTTGSGKRSLVIAAPGQTAAVVAEMRADPRVAAILPDSRVSLEAWPSSAPNDPYYAAYQPDLALIGVPTAWATTTGLPSVIVAVLDTGMMTGHVDLDGIPIVSPRNEITNTTDVTDGNGHGTHVTGTIAAETNNGSGVAGIAPGVSIMPVKVLDDTGSGYFSDLLDGVDWARTHGATVVNMSVSGSLDSTSIAVFQSTFDAAYAAGMTVVAAAGNDGTSNIEYPGGFDHVLSIGATDNSDAHASFSQTNATVDLSAPGVGTVSTYKDGGYAFMSGTSMATPHAAGVVALVRSAHPLMTPHQIETVLRSTAVDLGVAGRDDVYGSGRINAAAAVAYVIAPDPTPTPAPTASPTSVPSASPTPAPILTPAPPASPSPVPSVTPAPSASPTPSPSPTPVPDTTLPVMTSLVAPALVTAANRSFTTAWSATDNAAVTGYEIRTKRGSSGAWSATSAQTSTSKTFIKPASGTWYVDVRARDAAGNRSAWREVLVIVPTDDRSLSFTSGTTRRTGSAYFAATSTTTSRVGARMTIHFRGSSFFLLATTGRYQGKVRITIDGVSYTVDQGYYAGRRATGSHYRVVVFSKTLANKAHTVVLANLGTSGRSTISVDAVAWRN